MRRRLNYTERKLIKASDVIIALDGAGPISWNAEIKPACFADLPKDANIIIEVVRKHSFMLFECGTVGEYFLPEDRKLVDIAGAEYAKFRLKIVDNNSGKILATTNKLQPETGEKHTLLPVIESDLGDEIWKLDFSSDEVELHINNKIDTSYNKGQMGRSLYSPAVFREVLFYIIFVEQHEYSENPDQKSDDWQDNWLEFASSYNSDKYPGPYNSSNNSGKGLEQMLEWIEACVKAFCADHKFAEKFSKEISKRYE